MKYQRLLNRHKECLDLYEQTNDTRYLMEVDCIEHFFGVSGLERYEAIMNFARNNNITRVFDIGCAYGHQSEVFLENSIDYVGIEACSDNFWNKDKFKYIQKEYPFKIDSKASDLAVSVLCLTWNCYLYEGEKTLTEQCEALQRDFKHCLLYLANDKIEFVLKYFKNHKKIDEDLYYFYN